MHLFFSTPVWASKIEGYEDINKELIKYIEDLKNKDPSGKKVSNVKGWHSKDFNLNDEVPKKFISNSSKNIHDAFNDMSWDLDSQIVKIQSVWTIINGKGAFNERHAHGNSDLSAAYYVKAPVNCGQIVFYDPRPAPVYKHPKAKGSNILNATINSLTPEDGLLVLFPSYLEHSVKPNLSDDSRIVISFNINLISKT